MPARRRPAGVGAVGGRRRRWPRSTEGEWVGRPARLDAEGCATARRVAERSESRSPDARSQSAAQSSIAPTSRAYSRSSGSVTHALATAGTAKRTMFGAAKRRNCSTDTSLPPPPNDRAHWAASGADASAARLSSSRVPWRPVLQVGQRPLGGEHGDGHHVLVLGGGDRQRRPGAPQGDPGVDPGIVAGHADHARDQPGEPGPMRVRGQVVDEPGDRRQQRVGAARDGRSTARRRGTTPAP